MTGTNGFVVALAVILSALLLLLIVQSVRRAFSRPGPTAAAMQAFSLTTGRVMLFIAVFSASMLNNDLDRLGGSSGAGVAVVGIVALAFQLITETRWPRQTGAVRVALLRRPSLPEIVNGRFLVIALLACSSAALALLLCLLIDPTVGAPGVSSLLIAATALVLMLSVAVLVVVQVMRRPVLAGVTAEVDLALRRVSAQRAVRGASAGALGFAVALFGNVHDLLTGVGTSDLSRALGTFLNVLTLVFCLGIFLLYLAGPNESRLQKSVNRALARRP